MSVGLVDEVNREPIFPRKSNTGFLTETNYRGCCPQVDTLQEMKYIKAPTFAEAVRLMNDELRAKKFVALNLLREKSTYVEFALVVEIDDVSSPK